MFPGFLEYFANTYRSRPAKGAPTPFSMISNFTKDVKQLEYAMGNPEMVVLTDWTHFTSQELRNITLEANIDPLWVLSTRLSRNESG
jgi:hypothetical protein